jgi:hypothetical protein
LSVRRRHNGAKSTTSPDPSAKSRWSLPRFHQLSPRSLLGAVEREALRARFERRTCARRRSDHGARRELTSSADPLASHAMTKGRPPSSRVCKIILDKPLCERCAAACPRARRARERSAAALENAGTPRARDVRRRRGRAHRRDLPARSPESAGFPFLESGRVAISFWTAEGRLFRRRNPPGSLRLARDGRGWRRFVHSSSTRAARAR